MAFPPYRVPEVKRIEDIDNAIELINRLFQDVYRGMTLYQAPGDVVNTDKLSEGSKNLYWSSAIRVSSVTQVLNATTLTQIGTRDHHLLTGLTDDDHTQYALKTGSITQLATRSHSDLQNLTADDHTQYLKDTGDAGVGQYDFGGAATHLRVDASGLMTWIGNGTGRPYGSYFGNETSNVLAVNNTYFMLSNVIFSSPVNNNFTFITNSCMRCNVSGAYGFNWYISAEATAAGVHVLAGVMVNASTTIREEGRNHLETPSANREFPIAGCGIIRLRPNDFIGVGVGSEDNTTIRVDHVGFKIDMYGG